METKVNYIWNVFAFYLVLIICICDGLPARNHGHTTETHSLDVRLCEEKAMKGHCKYYECLDHAMQCGGFIHNRTLGSALCAISRHPHQQITVKGLAWTRATNRCVLRYVAQNNKFDSSTWCWRVGDIVKTAFSHCASKHDICKILWADRKALSKIGFLTLIEAARNCPRAQVNRFITWTVMRRFSHSHHQEVD